MQARRRRASRTLDGDALRNTSRITMQAGIRALDAHPLAFPCQGTVALEPIYDLLTRGHTALNVALIQKIVNRFFERTPIRSGSITVAGAAPGSFVGNSPASRLMP